MIARIHLVAALALIALGLLVPLGLWVYARSASVDRRHVVAANERVFRSVRHLPGARSLGGTPYALYRWDVEGSMVPVDGYRTEYFLRLPRALPVSAIFDHYVRVLHDWRASRGSEEVQFTKGGVQIDVSTAETADGGRAREYAFYVSQ